MRGAKNAPRNPRGVLERRHGLAAIVERGAVVFVKRLPVNLLQRQREIVSLPENASRRGHRFAQQRPGFFEALQFSKGTRVIVGCREGVYIFFAR